MKCLMLAAGATPPARLLYQYDITGTADWTTLDIDEGVKPDVVFNLNHLRVGGQIPLPSASFDEIHCYNSLHMWGVQGDAEGFFKEFGEYWRLLVPGGHFFATVPAVDGEWAWADPGCTRMIHPVNLKYLSPDFYQTTQAVTHRYRDMVGLGWWTQPFEVKKGGVYMFALRKA